MTATATDLGPIIGHVQTDTFCEGCGYNLHTQAVVRDERLGILICRCPECGRIAAAGQSTSAARAWLNRLATVLLVWWVLFLLVLFGLCTLFLGMLSYGQATQYIEYRQDPPPPGVTNRYYYGGHYEVRRTSALEPDRIERERQERLVFIGVTSALSLLTGVFFAVLLWHATGWRRIFAMAPPLVGCGFAMVIWNSDPMMSHVRDFGMRQIGFFLLLEIVGVSIGLFIGRPLGRGALRLLVPPKLRQHASFLWTIDGKRLPVESAVKPAGGGTPIHA
jgi:hypothetical protein